MKKVKIILGIVTAMVVVFFSTGLFVKETAYSTQTLIKKPVADVFAILNDANVLKEWIPELQSVEVVEEKPGKIGSTHKMLVSNQGQTVSMTRKVLAYVENKKVTYFFRTNDLLKTDEYKFTATGDFTKIVKKTSSKSTSYLMSCVFPYFKGKLKEIDQNYLNQFKTFAEKE